MRMNYSLLHKNVLIKKIVANRLSWSKQADLSINIDNIFTFFFVLDNPLEFMTKLFCCNSGLNTEVLLYIMIKYQCVFCIVLMHRIG